MQKAASMVIDSFQTSTRRLNQSTTLADKHMLPDLPHGQERKVCHPTDEDPSAGTPVWGDGGYQGQTEAIRAAATKAQHMTCRRTRYKDYVDEEARRKNTTKARVRAKVEHPFRILKPVSGFTEVRYRGIWKNHSGCVPPSRW